MDFDKLNDMIDELNANFDIIEENAKNEEKEQLEDYKELFWAAYDYINNFYKLFEKVRIEKTQSIYIDIAEGNLNDRLEIRYGKGWASVEFGYHNWGDELYTVSLHEPETINLAWFDHFFKEKRFKDEIIPLIKRIDYGYMEKQFADKLNKAIAKKAEYLEKRYSKATER